MITEMRDCWNDYDWRDKLPGDVLIRLCEGRNKKKDLVIMARAMKEANPWRTERECVDLIIEWVCDWNSQYRLFPDDDEYNEMINSI